MVRFYLHIEFSVAEACLDLDGSEYSDSEAALQDATRGLRELLSEAIRLERKDAPTRIVVVDDSGVEVGAVLRTDVIPREWWDS